MLDADEVREIGMPASLREHSLARIDEDHRKIRGRGAGDHVPGVLLVARRVGDDEFAPLRREETIGHIDGDALLPLGGESVEEQRVIEVLSLRTDSLGIRLEGRQLILEDRLGVEQQPADERRLAVIDAAAGDEPQERLSTVTIEIGFDISRYELVRPVSVVPGHGHQKYPSCFFFSMLAAWS